MPVTGCNWPRGAQRVRMRSFEAWVVYCAHVRVDDRPDWVLGHTWVRVRQGGEVKDVCARSTENQAGRIGLVPLGPVRKLNGAMKLLTTLGSYAAGIAAIVQAGLRGWTFALYVDLDVIG